MNCGGSGEVTISYGLTGSLSGESGVFWAREDGEVRRELHSIDSRLPTKASVRRRRHNSKLSPAEGVLTYRIFWRRIKLPTTSPKNGKSRHINTERSWREMISLPPHPMASSVKPPLAYHNSRGRLNFVAGRKAEPQGNRVIVGGLLQNLAGLVIA